MASDPVFVAHAPAPPSGGAPQPNGAIFNDFAQVGQQQQQFVAAAANVANNPLAAMGMQYGTQVIGQGQQALNQYVSVDSLRYYFNVNNQYVVNKLKLVLFPYRHKSWKRKVLRDGQQEAYLPPRDDVNAPDLYIPLMAIVTYVLLVAAFSPEFTPELFGMTMSRAFVVIVLELAVLKLGFYLLSNAIAVPLLDLVSYLGYAFVSEVFIMVVARSWYLFYFSYLFAAIGVSLFMIKTLRLIALPSAHDLANTKSPSRRNYFLLIIAIMQWIVLWFMAVTTSLDASSSSWGWSRSSQPVVVDSIVPPSPIVETPEYLADRDLA